MNGVLWVLKSTETKLTSKTQRGINSLVEIHLYPKSKGEGIREMKIKISTINSGKFSITVHKGKGSREITE